MPNIRRDQRVVLLKKEVLGAMGAGSQPTPDEEQKADAIVNAVIANLPPQAWVSLSIALGATTVICVLLLFFAQMLKLETPGDFLTLAVFFGGALVGVFGGKAASTA